MIIRRHYHVLNKSDIVKSDGLIKSGNDKPDDIDKYDIDKSDKPTESGNEKSN